MENNWQQKPDKELVDYAEKGLHGLGPIVEAMRRLRHSTNVLTWVLIVFAFFQTVLVSMQLFPSLGLWLACLFK